MANRLIISGSIDASIEVNETVDSKAYSVFSADQIVGGSRGGKTVGTYTDAKASKYTGVVDKTTTTALASVTGFTKTGTDPSSTGVKAYVVTYDSALGTPGVVAVHIASIQHASLAVGEGVVVPIIGGTMANLKIHNAGYSVGVDEATCTCIAIGD